MATLTKEFIRKVKDANNIITVAGKYLTLKNRGRDYWACCPFHHEKTPSFKIDGNEEIFHCFGCHKSGDVITLVMHCENLPYIDAVSLLAKWAGIEMPEQRDDENLKATLRKKARSLEILKLACEFYQANLRSTSGQNARNYLIKRGINNKLIEDFHIGLALDYHSLINLLKGKGFSEAEIVASGVASTNEKGNIWDAMFDKGGERITFAIFNMYNECVGFTGRTLSTDKTLAKYRNTAQTLVYDKSNTMYGIDVVKKTRLNKDLKGIIVVEGNVDVISMHGAGFSNTIATMGTAMTPTHAKNFKRLAGSVYLCYDGDSAGQKAALRALDILEKEGLMVRVVKMPIDTDPDDFLRKNSPGDMQKLLDGAVSATDFRLDKLRETSDLNDNIGKGLYIRESVKILEPLSIPERELYLPKISKTSGVSVESLKTALNDVRPPEIPQNKPVEVAIKGNEKAEIFIVSSVAAKKNYASVFAKSHLDFISNPLYKRLCEKVLDAGESWKKGHIYEEFNDAEQQELERVINFEFDMSESDLETYWNDALGKLKRDYLQAEINRLTIEADSEIDVAGKVEKIKKIMELTKEMKK
ncbi:MAG: DNA primase [Christensenellaceae bacterium]|jgi:DNA primase|nr:DNA primase [Christensenellaceae bacterium]